MRILLATAAILLGGTAVHAQTIYPIDRAEILTGAKFDFKVEFPGLLKADQVKVTVNGADYSTALGGTANFIERLICTTRGSNGSFFREISRRNTT